MIERVPRRVRLIVWVDPSDVDEVERVAQEHRIEVPALLRSFVIEGIERMDRRREVRAALRDTESP